MTATILYRPYNLIHRYNNTKINVLMKLMMCTCFHVLVTATYAVHEGDKRARTWNTVTLV